MSWEAVAHTKKCVTPSVFPESQSLRMKAKRDTEMVLSRGILII